MVIVAASVRTRRLASGRVRPRLKKRKTPYPWALTPASTGVSPTERTLVDVAVAGVYVKAKERVKALGRS